MSVSIIACPSCKSLVLPDTPQCPNCHYIFDEQRVSPPPPQPTSAEPREEEVPCPGCNELVKKGLVRCWNCGTFMRQDIAETYRRMQVSPPKVIYSEVDPAAAGTAGHFTGEMSDSGRLVEPAPPPTPDDADEDADFEVTGDMADSEGEFELGLSEESAIPNELIESAPVFALKEEVPEPAPPAEPKPEAKAAPAAKDDKGAAAKTSDEPSRPEFSNEFENRFGIEDDATAAGEGLLRVALEEEAETGGRRRSQKFGETGARAGFRVYCPNGHCIEVQERHRGLTGRCPRCRATYVVPANDWDEEKAQKNDDAQKAAAIAAAVKAQQAADAGDQPVEISAGEYTRWMLDSHFHAVDLTKLRLKADSLLKDFQESDVGFSPDGVLVVFPTKKKGGLFGGGGDKKKAGNRELILDHLSQGKARDQLPCGDSYFYAATGISQLRVVQPVLNAEESMFAGIAVFGEGRIAVRLPKREGCANPEFLSYTLSDFRRLSKILGEFYGIKDFGADSGIPLKDVFSERRCHYTDSPLKILENIEYYKNDPGFKIKVIGYKCAGCGLVVSEEGRAKENLGGKDGKKIAKAKCPKCQKLFGDLPQYSFDVPAAP